MTNLSTALAMIAMSVLLPRSQSLAIHLNDTWVYSLRQNTWSELALDRKPTARRFAAHAYDSARDRLIVSGGEGDNTWVFFTTWALDLSDGCEKWIVLSENNPWLFLLQPAVYDSRRDAFVVIRGMSIAVLDLQNNTWSVLGTTGDQAGPTDYITHGAVYDSLNDRYVLFAGGQGTDPLRYTNRVRALDPESLIWNDISVPPDQPAPWPRNLTSAVYDRGLQRMIAFGGAWPGGYGGGVTLNDTWEMTLVEGLEMWLDYDSSVCPLARGQHARGFSDWAECMIVFGGLTYPSFAPYVVLNDLWILNDLGWENPFPNGPRPMARRGAHACCDRDGDRFVVFGGQYLEDSPGYVDARIVIEPKALGIESNGNYIWCEISLPT